MKCTVLTEAVICPYRQSMLSESQILYNTVKTGIGIIMPDYFLSVKKYGCCMAYALKLQAYCSLSLKGCCVLSLPPIGCKPWMAFPSTRDSNLIYSAFMFPLAGSKLPQTSGQFSLISYFMCSKCPYHFSISFQ